MKKLLISFLALAAAGIMITGCGNTSSGGSTPASDKIDLSSEKTITADLDGYCLKTKDAMLLFTGEGEKQTVYALIKDDSEAGILKELNDGDHISVKAEVLTDYFPMNAVITVGTVTEKDGKVCIYRKLYETLKNTYFLDDSIEKNEKVEIVSE